MRKYQAGQEQILTQVLCNQCGRELKVENGYLKEGCFTADANFGYFSQKDGKIFHFDLCEECFDKMIACFAVPAEIDEETELL